MFVVCSKKMQEVRNVGNLFIVALPFLLGNWFVTNINAYPQQYGPADWSKYKNPEYGEYKEGDIIPFGGRRQVVREKSLLWTYGVVNYYVDPSITMYPEKETLLEDAAYLLAKETQNCVRFLRIYNVDPPPLYHWVNITGREPGCSSHVGRNPDGPNILNLNVQDGCFNYVGHAIHEMLHTLGIYHEQSRSDRDRYIRIIRENILDGYEDNFEKYNDTFVTTYGAPYDYQSVMHYSSTAFSKTDFPTIIPRSTAEIGQRLRLSQYDNYKIRAAYGCL